MKKNKENVKSEKSLSKVVKPTTGKRKASSAQKKKNANESILRYFKLVEKEDAANSSDCFEKCSGANKQSAKEHVPAIDRVAPSANSPLSSKQNIKTSFEVKSQSSVQSKAVSASETSTASATSISRQSSNLELKRKLCQATEGTSNVQDQLERKKKYQPTGSQTTSSNTSFSTEKPLATVTALFDKILLGEKVDKPEVKVLGWTKLVSSVNGYRIKLVIHDGTKVFAHCLLSRKLNRIVETLKLPVRARLTGYDVRQVDVDGQKRSLLEISGIEVLDDSSGRSSVDGTKENSKTAPATSSGKGSLDSNSRIIDLNPFLKNWSITALVTYKSPISSFNKKRAGTIFRTLLSDSSGSILLVGFNEQTTKFHDVVQVGHTYLISGCTVKRATRRTYELILNSDSIVKCCDTSKNVRLFNFLPLRSVETKRAGETVDVLGVVHACGEVKKVFSRNNNKYYDVREISIVDKSEKVLKIEMWGTLASVFRGFGNPIVAVKLAKVKVYKREKSLEVDECSLVFTEPTFAEALQLREWYTDWLVKLKLMPTSIPK